MKFRTILPGHLYARGRFDKYSKDTKLQALREWKIDTVVNFIRRIDPDIMGPDGVEYFHLPIADGKIGNRQELLVLADKVAERMSTGRVLVHCNAGRNRSGLICALALRKFWSVSGLRALDYVRTVRPRAIDNVYFEEFLRSLT